MNLSRQAYATTTSLYLPEAYCIDEKSLFRDVDAAMKNLQGDTLRMALRHLYIKWGDYCDEGREEFATEMMALADAGRRPILRKPSRRTAQAETGAAWKQTALF